jgi:hypothetical protein
MADAFWKEDVDAEGLSFSISFWFLGFGDSPQANMGSLDPSGGLRKRN